MIARIVMTALVGGGLIYGVEVLGEGPLDLQQFRIWEGADPEGPAGPRGKRGKKKRRTIHLTGEVQMGTPSEWLYYERSEAFAKDLPSLEHKRIEDLEVVVRTEEYNVFKGRTKSYSMAAKQQCAIFKKYQGELKARLFKNKRGHPICHVRAREGRDIVDSYLFLSRHRTKSERRLASNQERPPFKTHTIEVRYPSKKRNKVYKSVMRLVHTVGKRR